MATTLEIGLLENIVEKAVLEAIRVASIKLPEDVRKALEEALRREESEMARHQLSAMLENAREAERQGKPICQDTGLITFFVRVGREFPGIGIIERALTSATRRATVEIPLRPNTVHPLTGENPGDNTGRLIPCIHWEITEGNMLEITVVPKGGGSEGVTVLELPPPGEGVRVLKRIVVDAVLKAGGKPCPPTIVGVGVGGGCELAVLLAKKAACLRKIGSRNPEDHIALLEDQLLNALNELGIGPMGLGGKTTVLDVHIEYAHRHPATYPVAVAFQCWAARRATVLIDPSGSFKITQ